MAFIIRFAKGVRNHWKKSTFAAIAIAYGCNYAKESYDIQMLMRSYCKRAVQYGQEPIPAHLNPRSITVILNPNANKRKATKQFEKYCAPILNLAGICVDIVQTESEGHAKLLTEELSPTDAIVVAGGDGTLSEVVTGLLRHCGESGSNLKPIGILPLGKTNTIAKRLFPGEQYLHEIRALADASLAVIEEVTKSIDVMKIEVIDGDEQGKPVYAVSAIEWGAYRDADMKQDKYWYFGSLRRYATYIFSGFKTDLNWHCEADVCYSLPCDGCSNCKVNEDLKKRWYQRFMPYKDRKSYTDYSKIINEDCHKQHEKKISTADLSLLTTNAALGLGAEPPKLQLKMGPDTVDYIDFVSHGWQSVQGNARPVKETIDARQIEIKPTMVSKEGKEMWFSIDKEDFEVKPVKITLLPQIVKMFCKKQNLSA